MMGWEKEGRFPGLKFKFCSVSYRFCNERDWEGEGRMGRESFNYLTNEE